MFFFVSAGGINFRRGVEMNMRGVGNCCYLTCILFLENSFFGKSSFEYTCLADKKRHHFLDIINGSIVVDDDILENDIVERTSVFLVV